jgi:hypothetical protein
MDTYENMQESDYRWFIEHYSDLFKEYGKTYLAIKNKKVIGVYSSYAKGVWKTRQKEKLGTFIIQECNGNESAYTNYIASMNFMPGVVNE